ncbi:MAG: hypothetical protein SV422_15020 [Pseudomonadota bacterium]|nr:hypothetical protein [Pseudomonadota bacterium]
MKTTKRNYLAIATSALLAVGLIPLGFAESAPRELPEGIEVITVVANRPIPTNIDGIEVITVVGKQAMPANLDGVEVITVVAKRIEPTVASTCVNEVLAGVPASHDADVRNANRDSVRQAIRECIDAQLATTHS